MAPILRSGNERSLYLPPGEWYDFFTREHFHGGRWVTRRCSIEDIPVFVRAGTVLPLGTAAQSTAQLPERSAFELSVFLDAAGRAGYRLRDGKGTVDIEAREENGRVIIETSEPVEVASTRVFSSRGEMSNGSFWTFIVLVRRPTVTRPKRLIPKRFRHET